MGEPSMGPDPMGGPDMGPDSMGGSDMGPDSMGGPDDSMPSMDGTEGGSSDDQELLDIINGLSIEDKAAVTKYAKSMADRSGGDQNDKGSDDVDDFDEPGGGEPPMPMEARRRINAIISEITNELSDGKRHTKRNRKYVDNKKSKRGPFDANR